MSEALGTHGAVKWFLASVGALMLGQIGAVLSRVKAELAQVLLVAFVPVPGFLYFFRTQGDEGWMLGHTEGRWTCIREIHVMERNWLEEKGILVGVHTLLCI